MTRCPPLEGVVHPDEVPPLKEVVQLKEMVHQDVVPLEEKVLLDVVHLEGEVPLDVVHLDKVPQDVVQSKPALSILVPLEEVVPRKRCLRTWCH